MEQSLVSKSAVQSWALPAHVSISLTAAVQANHRGDGHNCQNHLEKLACYVEKASSCNNGNSKADRSAVFVGQDRGLAELWHPCSPSVLAHVG